MFLTWLNSQPPPSYEGVPVEGQIGVADDADNRDNDHNGDESQQDHGRKRNRSRQHKLHDRKMSKIQENHYELLEIIKYNRTPADEYLSAQEAILKEWRNRKRAAKPGHPSLDRLRGPADLRKGEKRKKRKTCEAASAAESDPVLQLRERIRKKGLTSGQYVEVVGQRRERWFMRIVDGRVLDKKGDDPCLAKALWCDANSVNLSRTHTMPVQCPIRSIIDTASRSKFNTVLTTQQSQSR